MRRFLQVRWHPRSLQPPRDINGHGLVSAWCWLFMLAGKWTPTVQADSAAPKSSSAPAASPWALHSGSIDGSCRVAPNS